MDKERYLKIRKELDDIKGMLENVNYQMQELRESIRGAPIPTTQLPMSEPYIHPWWQHQWTGPVPSRNNLGGKVSSSKLSSNKTGSGVSGAETQA
jgi:hypothetical protein